MTARVDHLDSEQIKIRPNIRFLFLFVVFFFLSMMMMIHTEMMISETVLVLVHLNPGIKL